MGIERITEAILAAAEDEARAVLERAKADKSELLEKSRAESEAKTAAAAAEAKKMAATIVSRAETAAGLEARKMKLAAKQDAISAVFDRAKEMLLALPRDDYKALLLGQLKASGVKKGVLSLGAKDRELGDELIKESGLDLTLSDDALDTDGGFTLKSGSVEVDCRLDMLISSVRDEVLPEVVSALFGE